MNLNMMDFQSLQLHMQMKRFCVYSSAIPASTLLHNAPCLCHVVGIWCYRAFIWGCTIRSHAQMNLGARFTARSLNLKDSGAILIVSSLDCSSWSIKIQIYAMVRRFRGGKNETENWHENTDVTDLRAVVISACDTLMSNFCDIFRNIWHLCMKFYVNFIRRIILYIDCLTKF